MPKDSRKLEIGGYEFNFNPPALLDDGKLPSLTWLLTFAAALSAAIAVLVWQPSAGDVTEPSIETVNPIKVAVLRFLSQSGDEEEQYFSDGISEDLIIDPATYWHAQAMTHYFSREYEKVIAPIAKAIELNQHEIFLRWALIVILVRLGEMDDAEWEVEEVRALGYDGDAAGLLKASIIVHEPYRQDLLATLRLAGFDD